MLRQEFQFIAGNGLPRDIKSVAACRKQHSRRGTFGLTQALSVHQMYNEAFTVKYSLIKREIELVHIVYTWMFISDYITLFNSRNDRILTTSNQPKRDE